MAEKCFGCDAPAEYKCPLCGVVYCGAQANNNRRKCDCGGELDLLTDKAQPRTGDPPLPDDAKLAEKGYERTGEIHEPVTGVDMWVTPDGSIRGDGDGNTPNPIPPYGKRRHIVRRQPFGWACGHCRKTYDTPQGAADCSGRHVRTPTGKDATMTNEEKYPLIPFTTKPTCQACHRTRFRALCIREYANTDVTVRPDARYSARTCRHCGAILRMKYAADSPQAPADPHGTSRARRAAWWLVKLPFATIHKVWPGVKWLCPTPLYPLVYAGIGTWAAKNPDRAWNLAVGFVNAAIAMVG